MAKIIKIGSQNSLFTPKAANLSKTSRVGHSTNPFKFNDFEGNTLNMNSYVSADIFESSKNNKLRMIASSVTGSMNKIKNSITEPIVNFVNRVYGGITNGVSKVCDCTKNAWNYAKNTNVEIPGMKTLGEVLNKPIHLSDIKNNISSMSEKWSNLISKVNHNKYTAETPVSDLELAWKNIIELENKEVA
jgi:hypothetical protein